ncbi:MAG: ATP-binding cassette domain-containing protein [Candidatus Ozemobacteraceae bacterium]
MISLQFKQLSFTHQTACEPLFKNISVHFSPGWTGIIGPNGSGKTTLLQMALGTLEPQDGYVLRKGLAVYCPQRTDDPPDRWIEFLHSSDAVATRFRRVLHIDIAWQFRWNSLSHGERKRVQIAVALWQEPDIFLVDEPTNHLDEEAVSMLQQAMEGFSGTGLLVSHDRTLLDSLCGECVFLEPPIIRCFVGGYSRSIQQLEGQDAGHALEREHLQKEHRRLHDIHQTRQEEARKADGKKSRRHLARHDSDGRAKIGLGIVTGKDGIAGQVARQVQGRIRQVQQKLDAMSVKKEYSMDFWLEGKASQRDALLRLNGGIIPLGDEKTLCFPDLIVGPADRIAIVGPNGSGKSLFVKHLVGELNLASEKLLYVPQEISLAETTHIMSELKKRPKKELGVVFSVISCLGSRPERLLQNDQASPGEVRKCLLALGIARECHLIIMDEPTNHLDLPSIRLLENALAGCPCGLLLVSHDTRFLETLVDKYWVIRCGQAENHLVAETRFRKEFPGDNSGNGCLDEKNLG